MCCDSCCEFHEIIEAKQDVCILELMMRDQLESVRCGSCQLRDVRPEA